MSNLAPLPDRMFSVDSPKAIKSREFGYLNAILYVAPHSFGGVGNLCPKASEGCKRLCLGLYSGQASMVKSDDAKDANNVRKSRILKAQHFMKNRAVFMRHVAYDIARNARKAHASGLKLAIRLNGSSDIAFEGLPVTIERDDARTIAKLSGGLLTPNAGTYGNMFEVFPSVQFLDYTKLETRMSRKLPANYSLTFSRSEINEAATIATILKGKNVAIVFEKLPETWQGTRVINGDIHDLRFLDPLGVIVGLTPKGSKAKKDQSGFVIRNA